MQKGLRAAFGSKKVRLTSWTPTSTDEQTGLIDYEEIDRDGEVTNTGTAQIFNCADELELDDENCLTGNSRLSASGEFISVRKPFDRKGLGRK